MKTLKASFVFLYCKARLSGHSRFVFTNWHARILSSKYDLLGTILWGEGKSFHQKLRYKVYPQRDNILVLSTCPSQWGATNWAVFGVFNNVPCFWIWTKITWTRAEVLVLFSSVGRWTGLKIQSAATLLAIVIDNVWACVSVEKTELF